MLLQNLLNLTYCLISDTPWHVNDRLTVIAEITNSVDAKVRQSLQTDGGELAAAPLFYSEGQKFISTPRLGVELLSQQSFKTHNSFSLIGHHLLRRRTNKWSNNSCLDGLLEQLEQVEQVELCPVWCFLLFLSWLVWMRETHADNRHYSSAVLLPLLTTHLSYRNCQTLLTNVDRESFTHTHTHWTLWALDLHQKGLTQTAVSECPAEVCRAFAELNRQKSLLVLVRNLKNCSRRHKGPDFMRLTLP